jgi:hypothetical protein
MNVLEMASYIARSTYTNEFCPVCGRAITIDEEKTVVSSDMNKADISRSAHKDCSLKQVSEKTWTYATDKI